MRRTLFVLALLWTARAHAEARFEPIACAGPVDVPIDLDSLTQMQRHAYCDVSDGLGGCTERYSPNVRLPWQMTANPYVRSLRFEWRQFDTEPVNDYLEVQADPGLPPLRFSGHRADPGARTGTSSGAA